MENYSTTTLPLSLSVCPTPYTLAPLSGMIQVWKAPEASKKGVYLWCLEYKDAFLVNYVGQTSCREGFAGRLYKEDMDYQMGYYIDTVHVEDWKRGVRRVISHGITPARLKIEMSDIRPLIRIFLLPLEGDASEIRSVESTLVNRLRPCHATFQFLANGDKQRAYRTSIDVEFNKDCPRLIGLTAPIPQSLVEDVARACLVDSGIREF
jgi:hypothetical protein